MHLLLAMALIIAILLSLIASIVLYDAISMSIRHQEPDPKSIIGWTILLLLCVATSSSAWLLLPGSKLYLAVYFIPAFVLTSMMAVATTRNWIGAPIIMCLLLGWLGLVGFFSSAVVFEISNNHKPAAVYMNYKDCKQIRQGTGLVWRCTGKLH